jgi:ribosomal protein S27AE
MEQRPKCFICENEAMLLFASRYICGKCYMKLYRENQKRQMEQLNSICNTK